MMRIASGRRIARASISFRVASPPASTPRTNRINAVSIGVYQVSTGDHSARTLVSSGP
jgi:hypothetical protein